MSRRDSPIGRSVSADIKESLENAEFKAEHERLPPYEELARIVIMRRAALGLTQAELATRMGTASAISRIESGQHATSSQTVKKLADPLALAHPARAGRRRVHRLVQQRPPA